MSWIINGKRYNPETATQVVSYNNLCEGADSTRDFGYYEETLYLTPRGNWFLAGSGGPASKYSRSTGGNGYSGGSGCTPIGGVEARKTLERWKEYDLLEKYFSDTLEDA